MLSKKDLMLLDKNGWLYKVSGYLTDIVAVGQQLGRPIPSKRCRNITDLLVPKAPLDAPKGSLSSIYGLEEFPFHTDGAYHRIPPKYIVFKFIDESSNSGAIRILDFQKLDFLSLENRTLFYDVWLVTNGLKGFYTSILSDFIPRGKTILRYNKDCMSLYQKSHTDSSQIMENKLKAADYVSLSFEPGSILILDNWRILHGRDNIPMNSGKRVIERLFVAE